MARINVTGNQVLAAVVRLLRASLDLDESTCFEVANADDVPAIPQSGDFWVTVAQGDGQFEPGNQDPGQLSEETEVIVSGYTRLMTDRTDHSENLLHDPERGCLFLKGKLLSALVGKDLSTPTGDVFLRQLVWATRSSPAQTGTHSDSDEFIGRIQVVFRIEFDWALETL